MNQNQVAVCLIAAFQPTPTQAEMRSVAKASHTLKQAIARMGNEASELKEVVASTRRPFRDTLTELVEQLIS